MWTRLRQILEMIRFSHTLFALPFALLAAAMAWLAPTRGGGRVAFRPLDLVAIVLCMVFARSSAMAFNRLVDRDLDAANPRTRMRHLPAGLLSVSSVAWFTIGSSVAFVAATALFLPNWLPLALAVPVLAILLSYSLTKRFTALAHVWLGLSLMLAPVSAWIAIRGRELLHTPSDLLPAGILGLAVLLWVTGFDIIYACQDADFDRRAKLNSIPARLGILGALRVAAACHAATLLVLFALPGCCPALGLGGIYYLGVAAVTCLLIYEHLLVSPTDLSRVNQAFFQVNVVISIGLLTVGLIDLLW